MTKPPLESPREGRRPHGGARKGAGRKKGTSDTLPRGMVKAISALRHRVPEDASPEAKAVADEAMATVVNVMRGKGGARFVRERLTAAAMVREEVCGTVPKKHEVAATVSFYDLVLAARRKREARRENKPG